VLKKTAEDVEGYSIDTSSIVEFHDPNQKECILGIVESCEARAKGGAKVAIIDADGQKHSVDNKAIHISLGVYKGKLKEPSDILKEFISISTADPTKLGVEPETLEMAWELCAEDSAASSFSAKSILSLIDESLYQSQVGKYRAFKLLTSDIGKVFFKTLSNVEFKAKKRAAVEASKQNWCHEARNEEFCMV